MPNFFWMVLCDEIWERNILFRLNMDWASEVQHLCFYELREGKLKYEFENYLLAFTL